MHFLNFVQISSAMESHWYTKRVENWDSWTSCQREKATHGFCTISIFPSHIKLTLTNTIFVAPLDPNFKEESEVWLSEMLNLQYFTIWNYSVLNIHRGIIQIFPILTLQNLDFNDQQKLYLLLVNKDPYRELQNWNK